MPSIPPQYKSPEKTSGEDPLARDDRSLPAPWTHKQTRGWTRFHLLSGDFTLVWFGQVVSQVGDGVSKLALLWFVYSVTGSALKTSVIGLLQTVPAILLAPLIGVAVDRLPKKVLLIGSDIIRAIVLGLIPCWMSADSFTVTSLYLLVTLHAIATAVFGPAMTAAIPSLVRPSQYTSANALLQSTTSLGIIMGPALSGVGIAMLSSQEVLCLNAATYVIAALCFVPIRLARPATPLVKTPPIVFVLHDLIEGFRYMVKGQPIFLFLTATAAAYTFATSAFTTLFPVFGRRLLDLGPVEVGYLWSMLGVGLLATSLALTSISAWDIRHRIGVIVMSCTLSGLVLLSMIWTKNAILVGGLLTLLGAGIGVLTPIAWGVLQERTPPHLLGRILAFYTMGAMAAAMGGITFFGWVTGEFGEPTAVVLIGLVMLGTALMAGFFMHHLTVRPLVRKV